MTEAKSTSEAFLVTATEPLLTSAPSLSRLSCAGHAHAPIPSTISRPHVGATKGMPSATVRSRRINQPSLCGSVEKVFVLRAEPQVGRIDALPVVARMADHSASRNRAVVELPRIAMRNHVAPRPESPVAARVEKARPFPTPIRLFNVLPESTGDRLSGFCQFRNARVYAFGHANNLTGST